MFRDQQIKKDVRDMYMSFPFPFVNADQFERFRKKFVGNIKGVVDINLLSGARVVDIGCGTGEKTCILSEYAEHVVGIDFSSQSIERALENKKKLGRDNVEFIEDSFPDIEKLDEQEFDVVFCSGVLHHLPESALGFDRIARLLKPGGVMIIALYHKHGRLHKRFRHHLVRILSFGNKKRQYALAKRLFYPHAVGHEDTGVDAKIHDSFLHPCVSSFSVSHVNQYWFPKNNIKILSIHDSDGSRSFFGLKKKTQIQFVDLYYTFLQKGFVYISGVKDEVKATSS